MRSRLIILLALLLSACSWQTPESQPTRWTYADLRILSTPNVTNPASDLIALYTRFTKADLQIRLDFLDLTFETGYDLYLALDTQPGGAQSLPLDASPGLAWDALIFLPATGAPQLLTYDPVTGLTARDADILPRVVRDPWNDTIVVSLNRNLIPPRQTGGQTAEQIAGKTVELSSQRFGVQAFLTRTGSPNLIDQLGPVRSDGLPPPRAQLLLAFWNAFPAYTPAQALRRWDGAHTGPFGGRHGLGVLLAAAKHAKVPIALLDLKLPAALSALDYMGALPMIHNLESQHLLILPEALPGFPVFSDPANTSENSNPADPDARASPVGAFTLPDNLSNLAAAYSRQTALGFGLSASQMLYTPRLPEHPVSGYPIIFSPFDGDSPIRWREQTLIPLPRTSADQQATPEGLSVDVRRRLLSNATASQYGENKLLILGGSLPSSAWGSPQSAEVSMDYIASHPWIQPLDDRDLMSGLFTLRHSPLAGNPSSPGSAQPAIAAPTGLNSLTISAAAEAANPAGQSAWDAYLALFASLPPNPPQLPQLRSLYAGEIGNLLAAASWAQSPQPRADCNADSDQDGELECILASENYFALFENKGARLVYLFIKDETTGHQSAIHQLIAPTSQFLVGLSDPTSWDLASGIAADPGAIMGAFSDAQRTWDEYQPSVEQDRISFTSLDGAVRKTFSFSESGLRVDYHFPGPAQVRIPLGLDPWRRFTPGWGDRYFGEQTGDGWSWRLASGPRVEIRSSGSLSASAFTESHALLAAEEDPNYDYPRGHYLPFPLALVEVYAEGDFYIQLDFSP
jgi:hypothetical protein